MYNNRTTVALRTIPGANHTDGKTVVLNSMVILLRKHVRKIVQYYICKKLIINNYLVFNLK